MLGSIGTVLSNDNDTSRKQLHLDFSPEVSPEKQVTFSVEIPEVCQQINTTPIVYEATEATVGGSESTLHE